MVFSQAFPWGFETNNQRSSSSTLLVYACRFGYYTKNKNRASRRGQSILSRNKQHPISSPRPASHSNATKSESPAAYELDSSPPTTLLWLAGESPPSQLFKTILKAWNSQLEPKVVFVLASVHYKIRDAADTPRANTSHQG